MKHEIIVRDVTGVRGYGPYGHGTWLVACSCGWQEYSAYRGRNHAEYVVGFEHRQQALRNSERRN